jgi:hypothetical protein
MNKKSQTDKFIDTCYYKLKVSRPLKGSQSNPLLSYDYDNHKHKLDYEPLTNRLNLHFHNQTIC